MIGYKTIVTPAEETVMILKKDLVDEIKSGLFDKQLLQDGIYENQIQTIRRNYWERGMYQVLFGKASFTESLISSEWYYRAHAEFNEIEQTAVIAGFLKSIEQLLFLIAKLSVGTGKRIRKAGGGNADYVEFTIENVAVIDSTMGAITGYLRHYSDLWDVNSYVKNYIVNRLIAYREKYRNVLFHKTNINNIEELKDIRHETLFLHYLLLGAARISDNDKEKFGIVSQLLQTEQKHDLTYSMVEEWLDRIIGGDVLLPRSAKISFEIYGCRNGWGMRFTTISGFNEYDCPEEQEWPYYGDDLKWDRVNDKDEVERNVILLLEEYLEKGKYSNILKNHPTIYAGWYGIPKILYER